MREEIIMPFQLGRLPSKDENDKKFLLKKLVAPTQRMTRYWGSNSWWGNQKQDPFCFPAGTPILMADGSEMPIEKISVGDRVISHTGEPRMVTETLVRKYNGLLTEIKIRGTYSKLISTPEHPYFISSIAMNWTPSSDKYGTQVVKKSGWKPAGMVSAYTKAQPHDAVHLNRGIIKPISLVGDLVRFGGFEVILTHNIARLIGLYLAEGWSRRTEVSFSYNANESLPEETGELLAEAFGGTPKINRRNNTAVVSLYKNGRNAKSFFDVACGVKSFGKRLHPSIFGWSDDLLQSLLDGYFDGDGHERRGGREKTFVTVSEQLARDIFRITLRLGYNSTISVGYPKISHTVKTRRPRYDVRIYPKGNRIEIENDILCPIMATKTEAHFSGMVYNLEVEHDHSYVANMAVVHNCVGYSWAHWLEDGPVTQKGPPPIVHPDLIYHEAQKVDEWEGEGYEGTSVRAGAKVLQSLGFISEYNWAWDLETLVQSILTVGPVVVGTHWYSDMFYPNTSGVIKVGGELMGGHAYVINGVNKKTKLLRLKNSWGSTWGRRGHGYISFDDMKRLISENGEVCLGVEVKKQL